jgi:hypothetical protein
MPVKQKPAPAPSHGGFRPGAGRKPVVRFCPKCGAECPSAVEARAHCAGEASA